MKYLAAPLAAFTLFFTAAGIASPVANAQVPDKIVLTPAQKTKLQQFRQAARRRIQGLMTERQRQQYISLRQRGIPAPQAIDMINLSRSRRDQLRRYMDTARKQFTDILAQP